MSKKFIPQIPNNDFVYPNNDRVEYDQTIVHEINDNCPSGTISGITMTQVSNDEFTLSFDYDINLNGSIPSFIGAGDQYDRQSLITVHMMQPNRVWMKPWKLVNNFSVPNASSGQTFNGTFTANIYSSQMGELYFPPGDYSFEFRIISEECVTPICAVVTYTWTAPTPTPTPTFVGKPTPTPTATPTATPVVPTPTPTATANVCTTWRISSPSYSGESIYGEYVDCDGYTQSFEYYWNTGSHYLCVQDGTMVVYDYGIDGNAVDQGTPCT
jgi:hypothetical protein